MARNARADLRKQVESIRKRLEQKGFPMKPAFKPHAKLFIALQSRFEAAAAAVDDADAAKKDALQAVGEADAALDAALDVYADELSRAGLGPRLNPFKPFSKYTPSAMKELAYATEPKEVRSLVTAVGKKKPPQAVTKASATCLARCKDVEKALDAYGAPSSAHKKALATRDALSLDMQKATKTLKKHAGSAYADDEATLQALFARPDAVEAPKRRRAKPKKTKAAVAKNGATAPAEA